jgi:hypothetical protein
MACSIGDDTAADLGDRGGTFRVADSQVASRWGNILEFEGFDLITPNERKPASRSAIKIRSSGRSLELHQRSKCKNADPQVR